MKCPNCGHDLEIETEKRKEFSEETRIKCLLWSDRHCCLCGKRSGTDIEIHHIDRKDDNSLENAIPLCYNCHAEISRYNDQVPMGNKYKPRELKRRRNQIYERYTQHLLSPTPFEITQVVHDNPTMPFRKLPNVGFNIQHVGNTYPLRALVKANVFLGKKNVGFVGSGYYNGDIAWHLNPLTKVYGNFTVMEECLNSEERLTIEVSITVIDIYDKSHELLPLCYSYDKKGNSWFLEPTEYEQLAKK